LIRLTQLSTSLCAGVAVEAEELADQLHGDDLAVRQERRAAAAEVLELGGAELIV
jgi:hypothetical protein